MLKNYKIKVIKTGQTGFITHQEGVPLKDTCNYFVSFKEKHKFYGKHYKTHCYYGREIELLTD